MDGKAEGILSCSFDGTTVGAQRVLAQTRNPSFLVVSADGRYLYAVNETVTFEDNPGGGVSAFSRARAPVTSRCSTRNLQEGLSQHTSNSIRASGSYW